MAGSSRSGLGLVPRETKSEEVKEDGFDSQYMLKSFIDVITHEPFVHPVVTRDGHSYEAESLQQHFDFRFKKLQGGADLAVFTSPLTGAPLPFANNLAIDYSRRVTENWALKNSITEFKKEIVPKLIRLEAIEKKYEMKDEELKEVESKFKQSEAKLVLARQQARADKDLIASLQARVQVLDEIVSFVEAGLLQSETKAVRAGEGALSAKPVVRRSLQAIYMPSTPTLFRAKNLNHQSSSTSLDKRPAWRT